MAKRYKVNGLWKKLLAGGGVASKARRRARDRNLQMESLERRSMLAGDSTFVATSANPGEAEAISLYIVNQMRHAPQTWATILNVDLNKDFRGNAVLDLYGNNANLSPKDSLIYNDTLGRTSANYSSILVTRGFLDHFLADAGGNTTPWTRAAYQGYAGGNVMENLAYNMVARNSSISNEDMAYNLVEQLFIDDGVGGGGHRMNILLADHSEVGFGFARGASGHSGFDNYYTTQNFGTETGAASKPYLTGFVLTNADGNLQYNQGEGLAGVTITIVDNSDGGTYTTTTGTYGYWDFPAVGGRSYTVSVSGGSFVGTGTASNVVVSSGGSNGYNTRSIDFFSGRALGRVDFGVTGNSTPTGGVSVTGGAEVGKTFTADVSALTDADGFSTLTYKWFANRQELTDALGLQGFYGSTASVTSSTLYLGGKTLGPNVVFATEGSANSLGTGDWLVGKKFAVAVIYTDANGALEVVASTETPPVTNMTVQQALNNLGNSAYAELSVSDNVANLLPLADALLTLSGSSLQPYHKIKDFHPTDHATVTIAQNAKLYDAIYKVKSWNDCFSENYFSSYSGGSITVSDTANNLAASSFGSANAAMQFLARRVEITGGSISSSNLLYWIESFGSKLVRKAGATITLTDDISNRTPAERAKVIAFLGDTTAPAFVGASAVAGTTAITLTFSESLASVTPAASAFNVVVNGVSQQPAAVAVSGSRVTLTVAAALALSDSVTVAYTTPATGTLQDISGNAASSIAVTSLSVVNAPPVFQSATTNADGTKVILTYDKALSATMAPPEAFLVEMYDSGTWANLIPRTVVAVAASGSTVKLTLDKPINNGRNAVYVSYTDPTGGNDANAVQEPTGIDAPTLTEASVTNAVTLAQTWLGTTGSDTWSGGAGNDEAYANLGSDTLAGNAGNDILDLGYYTDSSGGSLNDTSANSATGGDGNDEIYGTNGADTLLGDAGDDFLYGSGGVDTLNGGGGDDQLHGRSGSDLMTGGPGNDFIDGGSSSGDVVIFSLARSAYTVTQSGSSYIVAAKTGADSTDTVINVEIFRFSDGDVAVANILLGNVADATLVRSGAVLEAVSSTYGTASAATLTTISGLNLSGDITATAPSGFEVSSDSATWGSSATFTVTAGALSGTLQVRLAASTDAGTYSGNVTLTGGGASALSVAVPSSTIARKALAITSPSIASKIYDRSAAAGALTVGTISGLVASETLTVSGVAAVYRSANVGSYTTTVTYTLGDGSGRAANYSLAATSSVAGTITAKSLTVVDAAAVSRAYNGTTTATITGTLSGAIAGDTVTLGGSGTFANSSVGTGKAVTAALVLGGGGAGNYVLTQPTGLTANITPKTLMIAAHSKVKTYGNADPSLTFTASGLVAGDSITGNLSRAAGNGVGNYAINQGSVSAGSNYSISYTAAILTVVRRAVTITADALSKVAGQADPALTWKVTSGTLATGDSVHTAFTGGLTRVTEETAGAYAISRGTLTATNYQITFVGANFTIFAAATPLKINGVFVKGSSWSSGYQSLPIFTAVGSTNVGWQLADGATQLTDSATVGWSNVNTISIRFSQPIATPAAGAVSLVFGGNSATSPSTTSLGVPTILEGGTVAQWTLPANLTTGKYRIVATSSMFATAANAANTLDGEWTTYSGSFAAGSGDGTSGGDFAYDFDVLVGNAGTGDVSSSTKREVMAVNLSDNTVVTGQVGRALTALNFRCDVNGDGKIDSADQQIVQARIRLGVAASLTSAYYLDPAGRPKRS